MLKVKHANGEIFTVPNKDLPQSGQVVQIDEASDAPLAGGEIGHCVAFVVQGTEDSLEPGRVYAVVGAPNAGNGLEDVAYAAIN